MTLWTKEEQREHRKLWVAALRSGKYQQTTDDLKVGQGFCCLGVACDVSRLGRWDGGGNYITPDFRHSGELDPDSDITNWLGLQSGSGAFGPFSEENGRESLAHLNDSGKSFAEIADIIESEPEGLLHPSPEVA